MTMWLNNPIVGGAGAFTVEDDGTNYVYKVAGTTIWKTRKSDNQLLLDSGADDDAF